MILENFTIETLIDAYKAKKFTVTQVVQAYLDRISKVNERTNTYVCVSPELALEQAKKLDEAWQNDSELPNKMPLFGVPMGVKDNFTTKGVETTSCSPVLKGYVPSFDAPVVKKLYAAGAICLGKVNTDEMTCGASSETSMFGPSLCPYNTDHVAGGSSGGSASMISENLGVFATGTDTGGSIRLPASFCNAFGCKVSYGRVSRSGVLSMASSLDTVGHLTKTAKDAAIVLNVTAGKCDLDSTTIDTNEDFTAKIGMSLKGLKIGVPKEYFPEGIDSDVSDKIKAALDFYKSQGAELVDISLPLTKYGVAVYYIVSPSEVAANMERYDNIRFGEAPEDATNLEDFYVKAKSKGFGPEMKRRIMVGNYVLAAESYEAYYMKAQKVRTLIINEFNEAFSKVDMIMAPVSMTPSFKVGEKVSDPVAMYNADLLVIPSAVCGLPAASVPAGFTKDGLPIGLQIIAKMGDEAQMFAVANEFEKETNYYNQLPS